MAESGSCFIVRRGRPRKVSDKQLSELKQFLSSSSKSDSKLYSEMQKEYLNETYNQHIHLMVSRFPQFVKFPFPIKDFPLFTLLEEAVKNCMLTAFEISVFSLILENIEWNKIYSSVELLIICSSFLAKKMLESKPEDLEILRLNMSKKYKGFDEKMKELDKHMSFGLKEINQRYNQLRNSRIKYDINYNYYIDEIIRTSPPYNINIKKPKLEGKTVDNKKEGVEEFVFEPIDKDNFGGLTYENLFPINNEEALLYDISECYPENILNSYNYYTESDVELTETRV